MGRRVVHFPHLRKGVCVCVCGGGGGQEMCVRPCLPRATDKAAALLRLSGTHGAFSRMLVRHSIVFGGWDARKGPACLRDWLSLPTLTKVAPARASQCVRSSACAVPALRCGKQCLPCTLCAVGLAGLWL